MPSCCFTVRPPSLSGFWSSEKSDSLPDFILLKRVKKKESLSKRKHSRSYLYELLGSLIFQDHHIHWFFFFLRMVTVSWPPWYYMMPVVFSLPQGGNNSLCFWELFQTLFLGSSPLWSVGLALRKASQTFSQREAQTGVQPCSRRFRRQGPLLALLAELGGEKGGGS